MSETIIPTTHPGSFNEFMERNVFSSYTEAVEAHAQALEDHQIALNAIGEVINLQK